MQQRHQLVEGEDAGLDKVGIQQGKGRLKAHDAHGAFLQAAALFLRTVGRMVGGDHVDGAVRQPCQQRLPVGLIPQRGVHLKAAVLLQHGVVQQQIVGGSLAGHVQTLRLGAPDQLHTLLGGDVADMVAAACLPHQRQIPLDLPPLALRADAPVAVGAGIRPVVDVAAPQQRVVLAVGHDELAQLLGLPHGAAHHVVILYAPSVVGEGDDIRRQLLQRGQLRTLLSHGDRAVGEDADGGACADKVELRL